MSFKTIKPSFAGGELSPALAARVDLSKYHVGARELKNCFVHPHGGASNRAGTEFVAEAKYPDKPVKMLDFVFSVILLFECLDYMHSHSIYIAFELGGNKELKIDEVL